MDFGRRMKASMLVVIVLCMLCVAAVLDREERVAQAKERGCEEVIITCGMQ